MMKALIFFFFFLGGGGGGFILNLDYLWGDFYTFKSFFLRSRYRIGIFVGGF